MSKKTEKKLNAKELTEQEVEAALQELDNYDKASQEAKTLTENVLRLRQAEEIAHGKKTRLDVNKVIETVAGTLIPTLVVVHAEEIKNVLVTSKAFSKIKFK